jgi:hypothetical protein
VNSNHVSLVADDRFRTEIRKRIDDSGNYESQPVSFIGWAVVRHVGGFLGRCRESDGRAGRGKPLVPVAPGQRARNASPARTPG